MRCLSVNVKTLLCPYRQQHDHPQRDVRFVWGVWAGTLCWGSVLPTIHGDLNYVFLAKWSEWTVLKKAGIIDHIRGTFWVEHTYLFRINVNTFGGSGTPFALASKCLLWSDFVYLHPLSWTSHPLSSVRAACDRVTSLMSFCHQMSLFLLRMKLHGFEMLSFLWRQTFVLTLACFSRSSTAFISPYLLFAATSHVTVWNVVRVSHTIVSSVPAVAFSCGQTPSSWSLTTGNTF